MDLFRDILRLVRWGNVVFLGVLIWVMEKWVAVPILDAAAFGEQLPWYVLWLIILSVTLIAAGGYVINDYFDVKIDRINRPDELIVTRTISREGAFHLSIGLSASGLVSGLVAAGLLRSIVLAVIFILVPGLLWFYSSSYKRLLIIGNVTIALLAGLTPMIVAIANKAQLEMRYEAILPYTPLVHDLFGLLSGFGLFAFILTWIREIIKDMQDQVGDREMECHTMVVVWGEFVTKICVSALVILTIGIIGYLWWSVLPFPHGWDSLSTRYIVLGILIPLLSSLWLLWNAKIPSDYKTCQQVIKFTMFIGMLYSFVLKNSLFL